MSAPAKQPTPDKSDTARQIETLLLRIGPEPSVDSWTNHNGWTCCATVARPNSTRVVRQYAEGHDTRDVAERVCLAAVRSLPGGER